MKQTVCIRNFDEGVNRKLNVIDNLSDLFINFVIINIEITSVTQAKIEKWE